ncbi:MAG: hypothetical protein KAU16_04655 [Methanophagales archaeon]|nr:hypothetical protein [Methanophagales archaeon]
MKERIKKRIKEYAIYGVLSIFICICVAILIKVPYMYQQLLAISVIVSIIGVIGSMWKSFRSSEKQEKVLDLMEEEIKLLKFIPLEFWNEVKIRMTKGKKEICHMLYFTNNTKDKIPIRSYQFSVAKEGRDKPLIATNGFHFSSVVIPPRATKYPVPSPKDYFNPTKWGIESKGTYQIVWEVVYSHKRDTEDIVSVYSLEWEGIDMEKEGA